MENGRNIRFNYTNLLYYFRKCLDGKPNQPAFLTPYKYVCLKDIPKYILSNYMIELNKNLHSFLWFIFNRNKNI